MRLLKKFSCGGRRLWLLLVLQLLVLVFILGPLVANEEFYIWLDGSAAGALPGGSRAKGSPSDAGTDTTTTATTKKKNLHGVIDVDELRRKGIDLPEQNELSKRLLERNRLPPRNRDLFPSLRDDRVHIVLYVHNRPEYLRLAVAALAGVEGIEETLLIISHDGFFEEMNAIVETIRFCQVKQIFAPWSPHLFTDAFPGVSPGDCKDKEDAARVGCTGNPDQYGNHRGVRIVSLKHHWWWMMNTVWDGLAETAGFGGHTMFIEEDHYLFPNAYRNIQRLTQWKAEKCPYCIAANVAPLDVRAVGERFPKLVAEKVGNIGYTFNRTVWERVHAQAAPFCTFDDYNWDITMWATIYPTFGDALYTLRGPRTSALHVGKCGLHQGYSKSQPLACRDSGMQPPAVANEDRVPNVDPTWPVLKLPIKGYASGFRGWGGWGDQRDQQLCLKFSAMYGHGQPDAGTV